MSKFKWKDQDHYYKAVKLAQSYIIGTSSTFFQASAASCPVNSSGLNESYVATAVQGLQAFCGHLCPIENAVLLVITIIKEI